MRIKLVFIVVVIFVLMFFFWNDKDEIITKQEIVKKTIATKTSNKIDIKQKPAISQQANVPQQDPASKQNNFEESIDIIYRELGAERYSQEPALELVSVMKEMYDCGYIKSYKRYKFIDKQNQLSLLQQDIYRKYQDKCIGINDTYPTIVDYNQSRSSKQDFMWVMMNSPYRELIVSSKNFKKLDSYAQTQFILDLTKAVINSQNSQMLLFLSSILIEEIQFFNALKLPEVLSSINTEYVQMIVGQATVLMSCEYNNGISCAPSSHHMTVTCFENEIACGMDIKSWFNYNHSFSHNQDIFKIIAYFKSL